MPISIYRLLYRIKEVKRLSFARARMYRWKLCGAHVEPKCLFGRGTLLEHPWRIWIGTRCVTQNDVWLNVGSNQASLFIGEYTFIGRGTEIEVTNKVLIGKGCLIAPNVYISDHNHGLSMSAPMFQQPCISKPVILEDDVWIGTRAVILPGVTLGKGAVVAAGAVVNQNVKPYDIVGGVPATVLKSRKQR